MNTDYHNSTQNSHSFTFHYSGNTDVVDPWHYTGNKEAHSSDICAAFISACKAYLPQRALPIHMGDTGYININSGVNMRKETNAWCLDEVGRYVILINGTIIFQRYTEGNMLVASHNGFSAFSQVRNREISEYMDIIKGSH